MKHMNVVGQDFMMQLYVDPQNLRLRVDDYLGNTNALIQRLQEMAQQYAVTKVFVKARQEDWQVFLSCGFILEGVFKRYYNGSDAYSMAFYYSAERRTSDYWMEEDQILQQVLKMPGKQEDEKVKSSFPIRMATPEDALSLASLYGKVFQTYPTPMDNADYIKKVMEEGTLFYVVESDGDIVSSASAEVNTNYHNAEMTDCATDPAFRKHGLMKVLISALEAELFQRNIYCSYSLARALSFGMNAVFRQLGYEYTGRLIKNCNIFDKYEDMNLWVKRLA
jgi:beta-lysine N6-acetyltransferase